MLLQCYTLTAQFCAGLAHSGSMRFLTASKPEVHTQVIGECNRKSKV